jgi:hypothetical protein
MALAAIYEAFGGCDDGGDNFILNIKLLFYKFSSGSGFGSEFESGSEMLILVQDGIRIRLKLLDPSGFGSATLPLPQPY